ncbi:heterokaryon incompatibility protein-domain-containing protein [Xylogone sp. PMI_703]|nr:heterokaryon incompatibility protein-domain-containing protein [Xylogone sp. PMI_703]
MIPLHTLRMTSSSIHITAFYLLCVFVTHIIFCDQSHPPLSVSMEFPTITPSDVRQPESRQPTLRQTVMGTQPWEPGIDLDYAPSFCRNPTSSDFVSKRPKLVKDRMRQSGDSLDCSSRFLVPFPDSSTLNAPIAFRACRSCAGAYKYELSTGDSVTIIAGIPTGVRYKAISYVWGKPSGFLAICRQCGSATKMQIESCAKFNHIMTLSGADTNVWLDTLSIDQSDANDKQQQMAAMGSIYDKADCVAVLLPASDGDAFDMLDFLSAVSMGIIESRNAVEDSWMSTMCTTFFAAISSFEKDLYRWTYWRRAWTFQEWALGRHIEVACESRPGQSYSNIDLPYTAGELPPKMEAIKRIFPYEDLYLSYNEIDAVQRHAQNLAPSLFGIDQILGLRIGRGPHKDGVPFAKRLSLMLDAFAAHERETRFEADLVACWASMCNIQYDYCEYDTLAVALQKVLKALRQRGIRVYNFTANRSGTCAETDPQFLTYSRQHRQCNNTNKAWFTGAPAFTGIADTTTHLLRSTVQFASVEPLIGNGVAIRPVVGTIVESVTVLSDLEKTLAEFDKAACIREALAGIPSERSQEYHLYVGSVPMRVPLNTMSNHAQSHHELSERLYVWAICPRDAPRDHVFIAREELNGTLVLVALLKGEARLVAYLTATELVGGTFLIPSDDTGRIELVTTATFGSRRYLRGTIELSEEPTTAFGGPLEHQDGKWRFLLSATTISTNTWDSVTKFTNYQNGISHYMNIV